MTAIDPPRRRSFVPAVLRLTPLARREARWGYIFISPWIIGFLAFTFLPMVATFVFTFTNINLAQEEPLAFVGLDNYAAAASTTSTTWDVARRHVPVRGADLPIALIIPFVVALALNSTLPALAEPVPDAVLPAVRGAVRRRRPRSGRACSTSRPAG